ncbi:pseudouridine synthase [uncultured Porphyromonas sp.]|uniref:pseudouridine synthase n=1 Tax=uncultured Porphyromonas sp. TaxID=159274 RepID=UPI00260841DB|nr:pseudouridine synthase [uncultured Porphyromonas sp.]
MPPKPSQNIRKAPQRERIYSFTAKESGALLELLFALLPELSRTTVKQYLRNRCVVLAGVTTTQFDAPVATGETIEIYNVGAAEELQHPLIEELYRDEQFIVLHKRPGIPTISVGGASKSSLFQVLTHHLKKVDPNEKIFLLNRLDRDTEGIIIVARDRQLQQDLLAEWRSFVLSNSFEAVVLGTLETSSGELTTRPTRDKKRGTDKRRSAASPAKGKKPATFRASYEVLATGPYITRVSLSLLTRNNSIRSTLASIGHPLLGDRRVCESIAPELSKYLALRTTELTIFHPIRRQKMQFTLDTPLVNLDKIAQTRLTAAQKEALLIEETASPKKQKTH